MARIKLRRDTGANWASYNPILDNGEPGYETDTEQLKIGNGVDDWLTLPYFFGGFDGGTINNPLVITADAQQYNGALELSGGLYDSGTAGVGLLQVGGGLNFEDTDIMATFVANVDSYAQIIISNKSNGSAASSDIVVNNDSTAGTNIYGNFGINSTNFVGTGGPFDQFNTTYLIAAGGELAVGTVDPHNFCLVTNDVARVEIANDGEVEFQPSAKVHILNTTDAINHQTGALVIEGGLGVGKTIVCDDNIYIGQDAVNVPLTDPVFVVKQPGVAFIQAALVNSTSTGSADWIAYGSDSTETEGWADFGFTGPNFNDPTYTITEHGEGYIFVQGKPTSHGSLVLCTGDQGTDKDIVFGTGGFQSTNERMRLVHNLQCFHVAMPTPSISTNSGAVVIDGGVGIDGALNVGGAINKVEITPPVTTATLTLAGGVTLNHPQSLAFPNTAGTAGAVLTTNGLGTLSYVAQQDIQITKLPYDPVTGNYTALGTDTVICVDPAGSPCTITLPHNEPVGKIYIIKKTSAASTVTIDTDNVFTFIDGLPTYTLNNLEAVTVVLGNDGLNNQYYIIGKVV